MLLCHSCRRNLLAGMWRRGRASCEWLMLCTASMLPGFVLARWGFSPISMFLTPSIRYGQRSQRGNLDLSGKAPLENAFRSLTRHMFISGFIDILWYWSWHVSEDSQRRPLSMPCWSKFIILNSCNWDFAYSYQEKSELRGWFGVCHLYFRQRNLYSSFFRFSSWREIGVEWCTIISHTYYNAAAHSLKSF